MRPNGTYRYVRWKDFGELISLHRQERGMSIRDVVAEVGSSAATLQRVEQGKPCSTDVYLTLCDWADICAYDQVA